MKARILALALVLIAAVAAFADDTPLSQYVLRRGDSTYMHDYNSMLSQLGTDGDFLWVLYNGKEYVIRDVATIDRAMDALATVRPARDAKKEVKSRPREIERARRQLDREERRLDRGSWSRDADNETLRSERKKLEDERARLAEKRRALQPEEEAASRRLAEARAEAQQKLSAVVEQAIREGKAQAK
jgi:hypothetical protein